MERYKLLMAVPALALLLSLAYIGYLITGPGLQLDIDLKGGTQVSLDSSQPLDIANIESFLSDYHPSVRSARGLTGYTTIIDVSADTNATNIIESLKAGGYAFDSYSSQTIGPALGASFFAQAQLAMV